MTQENVSIEMQVTLVHLLGNNESRSKKTKRTLRGQHSKGKKNILNEPVRKLTKIHKISFHDIGTNWIGKNRKITGHLKITFRYKTTQILIEKHNNESVRASIERKEKTELATNLLRTQFNVDADMGDTARHMEDKGKTRAFAEYAVKICQGIR